MAYNGTFTPINRNKYKGHKKIVWRSSWELKFMKYCDRNPNVIEWASEPFAIRYYLPTDKKWHKYWPDFWVKVKTKTGKIAEEIIEVKPKNQTMPPKHGKKQRKTIIKEQRAWMMNTSKWKFAKDFCKKHGIKFRIITEKELLV